MIKIFGKYRYHWQPELSWLIIYWSLAITPIFIAAALLFELYSVSSHIFELSYKKGSVSERSETLPFLVSLLSDSNQRPRDYKSRALAN